MMDVDSSRLVTVSCANFSQYLVIALRNLFDTRRGTDFDLIWDGRSARAHRIILELFLSTETIECRLNLWHKQRGIKQEAPDCDGANGNNVLESLLEFLYKGEVTLPEEQLGDLLRASKELDFKMLEDALVQSGNPKVVKVENEIEIKEEDLDFSEKIPSSSCYEDLGSCTSNNKPSVQEIDVQSLCVQEIIVDPQSVLRLECLGGRKDSNFNADDDSSNPEEYQTPRKKIKGEAGEVPVGAHPQNDESSETADGATSIEVAPTGTSKLNKCSHCEFQTVAIKSYRQHMLRTHGINSKGAPVTKNKCPHCKFETFVTENYKRHLAGLHGVDTKGEPAAKHKCPHCEYETSAAWNYQTHLAGIHGITTKGEPAIKHKCPHCKFETLAAKSYRQHLMMSHGIDTNGEPAAIQKCPHCEFETSANWNYRQHLAGTHGINIKGEPAPKHKCPHCDFQTSAIWNYRHHLAGIHGINAKGEPVPMHTCPHCEVKFITKNYQRHLISVHGVTVNGTPAPINKCDHCEFETPSHSTYSSHMMSAHEKTVQGEPAPVHKCPECDFSTAFINKLNRHSQSVHTK